MLMFRQFAKDILIKINWARTACGRRGTFLLIGLNSSVMALFITSDIFFANIISLEVKAELTNKNMCFWDMLRWFCLHLTIAGIATFYQLILWYWDQAELRGVGPLWRDLVCMTKFGWWVNGDTLGKWHIWECCQTFDEGLARIWTIPRDSWG